MTQQFTAVLPDGKPQPAQSESALHEVGQPPPPLPLLLPLLVPMAPEDDDAAPVAAGAALIAPAAEGAPWPAALFAVPRNPASTGGYP